ncbi:MAG TPA: hypothetical protein VGU44_04590, partial [Gammaproteobacteria bacterium]|nr:hypothetical protein [Gammaproteobacteria bacterium]
MTTARIQAAIDAAIADKKNDFDDVITAEIAKLINGKNAHFKKAVLEEFAGAVLDEKLEAETALKLTNTINQDRVRAIGNAIYDKLAAPHLLGEREAAIFVAHPKWASLIATSCKTNGVALTDPVLQAGVINNIFIDPLRKLTVQEEQLFTYSADLVVAAADAAGQAALAGKSAPNLVNNTEVGGELFRRMIVKGKAPLGDEEIALLEQGDEFFIRWAAFAFCNDETAISLGAHKKVAEAIRLMTESCLKEGDIALTKDTKDTLDQFPFVAKQVADAVT